MKKMAKTYKLSLVQKKQLYANKETFQKNKNQRKIRFNSLEVLVLGLFLFLSVLSFIIFMTLISYL